VAEVGEEVLLLVTVTMEMLALALEVGEDLLL
jgi:hypothetical protein